MRTADSGQRTADSGQRTADSGQRTKGLRLLFTFFRIFVSCILAIVILLQVGKFYKYIPSDSDPIDTDGATSTRYSPNATYSWLFEGFSRGKTNNEGYMNLIDYKKGMKLDIIVMGSSHMEALQIMPFDNTVNVLMHLSNLQIYNLGISGHFFETSAANFERALKKYKPSKYIIIESSKVAFTDEVLNNIISNASINPYKATTGIETVDLLRSFYRQHIKNHIHKYVSPLKGFIYSNILLSLQNKIIKNEEKFSNNTVLLSKVLKKMHNIASKYGTKVIIAYHPLISLNKDGSLSIDDNPEVRKQFSDLCKQNGIYFLDMSERFLAEYKKDFTLPYGFFNTSVGKGHMNKAGHRMFAEEIYDLMKRIERSIEGSEARS